MQPYLESLRKYADFPVTVVGVGFTPPECGFDVATLTREQNYGAPPETECIQHGSFVQVVDGDHDEVLVYTDGDFIMQRKLAEDERELLDLKYGEVVTSWNGGPDETLETEAARLGLKVIFDDLARDWDGLKTPIYNVGFLAMNRRMWNNLHKYYDAKWDEVGRYFSHAARQQWLISWIIDGSAKIAPWSLHAHGHFGLKPGMVYTPNGVYHNGRLAAFRHYFG
jgi:hypothetical protein